MVCSTRKPVCRIIVQEKLEESAEDDDGDEFQTTVAVPCCIVIVLLLDKTQNRTRRRARVIYVPYHCTYVYRMLQRSFCRKSKLQYSLGTPLPNRGPQTDGQTAAAAVDNIIRDTQKALYTHVVCANDRLNGKADVFRSGRGESVELTGSLTRPGRGINGREGHV